MHVRRLRRQNLRPDLRIWILFLRLRRLISFFGVGHFLDDRMHRVHVYLAGFLVELYAQVFFRLVILPRRHTIASSIADTTTSGSNVLLAARNFNLFGKANSPYLVPEFRP